MWLRLLLLLLGSVAVTPVEATPPFVGHGGPVKDLRAGEGILVSAGFDYSLVVWDPDAGIVRRRLMGHRGPVNAVAATSDGRLLVSTGDDGHLAVWDAAEGRLLAYRRGHDAKAVAIAVSADGHFAATAGWDGRVVVWRLPEAEPVRTLGRPPLRYTGVAFTDDGRLVAADSAGAVTAWRLDDGRMLWRVGETGFPATRLVRRGARLYLAGIDGTVRIRSMRDGREVARLAGERRPVTSLAVDRDGRRLAAGGARGTVQIWSVPERRVERVLEVAGGQVWALAFASDGRRLFVGAADGAIRVFDVAEGRRLAGPGETWVTETDRIAAATGAPALFGKCRLCHSLTPDDENKSGPTFWGLLGRRVGTLEDYPYSEALRRARVVWTEETLYELFAIGPDRYLPGTKMPVQRIEDRRAVRELVAWLARVTERERAATRAEGRPR